MNILITVNDIYLHYNSLYKNYIYIDYTFNSQWYINDLSIIIK